MICTKEIDEIDFVVVNRRRTKEERAEESQLISEAIALYNSLTAQGYSEEEVQTQFNARFAPSKKPRPPKTSAAASAKRRKRHDSAVLTA